ncbi:Flp family type IVb pilin [Sinomonas sp. G460-2]|uniref:Flp family type IVb pilin n=1 Tax=Sinomonas sp. G460-2 TaxID=3393464 RepID=UPI0039EF3C83
MNALLVSLMTFWNDITDRSDREKGATATEYALLVGLIALIIVVGVGAFGGALNTWFNSLATTVGHW